MNTKRKCAILCLCLMLSIFSFSKSPEQLLVGNWLGTDSRGEMGSLIFNEDGNASMVQGDMVIDGSSVGGKVTWKFDDGFDPIHLDLILTNASGESIVLPMILRFLDENKIMIRIGEDINSRPTSFLETEHDNQLILERQREQPVEEKDLSSSAPGSTHDKVNQ